MGKVIRVDFDPSQHPRGRSGRFAAKESAPEAGVELDAGQPGAGDTGQADPSEQLQHAWRDPGEQQRWCDDARAAMAPAPESMDERDRTYYDLAVSRAIEPGLDAREAETYAELMRGDDPETAHRFYSTISMRRVESDDPFIREEQRERMEDGLEYLAVDHPQGDPRVPAAVAAICHHDPDPERVKLKWDRFAYQARLAREADVGPRREVRLIALLDLTKGHPVWR